VVNEFPPAVRKKYQAVEQLQADCRYDEHVRGGNPCCVVAQEGRPALTRPSGALDHVLSDCRDLDAELEQLAVDPGRAPQPVGAAPPPERATYLSRDRGTAASGPRLPAPEGPEPPTMPANHRLWSYNRAGVHHARAEAIEPDERRSIALNSRRRPGARRCSMFT